MLAAMACTDLVGAGQEAARDPQLELRAAVGDAALCEERLAAASASMA